MNSARHLECHHQQAEEPDKGPYCQHAPLLDYNQMRVVLDAVDETIHQKRELWQVVLEVEVPRQLKPSLLLLLHEQCLLCVAVD